VRRIKSLFSKLKGGQKTADCSVTAGLQEKYRHFRTLLESNAEMLKLITDAEEKLTGRHVFGANFIGNLVMRSIFHTGRMVYSLDSLAGGRYTALKTVFETISTRIQQQMDHHRETRADALVLTYDRISQDMGPQVGGKNANIGEVFSRVGLPVPRGFAITTSAYDRFMVDNLLLDKVRQQKMELVAEDPQSIVQISSQIEALFQNAVVPADLAAAIAAAYEELAAALGRADVGVALRSSAIGEDSHLSFAGQYRSILNVTRASLLDDYKRVLASLFSPRAIAYRLQKGIQAEDIAMSVACLEMVPAVAAGVMYTRHPFDLGADHIIINGLWGLGPYVVDGVMEPDRFSVAKTSPLQILHTAVAHKPVKLVLESHGGLIETAVDPTLQDQPCLSRAQVLALADYGRQLEAHYGCAQDVEWALDPDGRLVVLQARPLRLVSCQPGDGAACPAPAVAGYPVVISGGDVACPGIGAGPVHMVKTDEDLLGFPDGGVLVAAHSSPKFVIVMHKAKAIVTDAGSITGHMASLAREVSVPTLLNTKTATTDLAPGQVVTVDAFAGRIYAGQVPDLISLCPPRDNIMQETPVYQSLRRVADLIVPLNLTDPQAADFRPQGCRSLHDVTRFVHERCYAEMFQLGDMVSSQSQAALRLKAPIALDLYIIDLGGGLKGISPKDKKAPVEAVTSIPFQSLLAGMLRPELAAPQARPIHLQGFFAVMSQQMLSPTHAAGQRFGDRSYAVISANYLNFSSRVGYHYSVLDTYCGPTGDMNYINFEFKGGAADDIRRHRRARLIQKILQELSFIVAVKGDSAIARFAKHPMDLTREKLDHLGRLLQFTRQMDMLMHTENSVNDLAKCFLEGDYTLEKFMDKIRKAKNAATG
jgi:pyruvate,water dikinase